jgi:hypothetical protein
MNVPLQYEIQHRIAAFSKRLHHLARTSADTPAHVDQKIKAENLRYGVGFTLARLLAALTFRDRSKPVFEELLRDFNDRQGATLTYAEFEDSGWVRCINGEVLLPSVVKYFVWQIGYCEQEGKPLALPPGKTQDLAFLREFYEQYYHEVRLTIAASELTALLAEFASPSVTATFLLERDVLGEKDGQYYWRGGNYVLHLRNEIAAALWLLTTGEEATENQFRQYVRQLYSAGIWPHDLRQFLTPLQTDRLSELATEVLLNEPDLVNTGREFRKIWLDPLSYHDRQLTSETPHVVLASNTSAALIQTMAYHQRWMHETFDYQANRRFYSLLVRLALGYDSLQPDPCANTIRLLKAVDRPYVVWKVFQKLHHLGAPAIPYLLEDPELTPLAFSALTKLSLSKFLVPESENRAELHRQQREFLGELWLELFGLYLDKAALGIQAFEEMGLAVGAILYERASNAFARPTGHGDSYAEQQASTTVYHKALTALGEKRSSGDTYYLGAQLPPKLIDELFSGISTALRASARPVRFEYLTINLAAIDLAIRLVQFGARATAHAEAELEPAPEAESDKLLGHLRQLLDDYYGTTELAVAEYSSPDLVLKPARRGIDYFSVELVAWGYLFCQFRRLHLLDDLATKFLRALQLNRTTPQGKYDEVNQREADKLRFFLRTLLLAYLDIRAQQSTLELEGLPAADTLAWLEKKIEQVAARHSRDDLPQGRLDLFEESLSLGRDAQGTSLTTLLYRCLNLFRGASRRQFIEHFFNQSLELGRMLAAINALDSPDLQQVVAEKIAQVDVEAFIKSKFSVTDLEETLLEAVNSAAHWEFAEPLLKRVQRHFEDIAYYNERQDLLFEIELLLLYKRKEGAQLQALKIPRSPMHSTHEDKELIRLKEYFVGLHVLYNEKGFDEAIAVLERLSAHDTVTIRYAYQLYRARTLKAINTAGTDLMLLQRAQQDWETFISKLDATQNQAKAALLEAVDGNSLHYYAHFGPPEQFDQAVSRLPTAYLIDEELVPVIYTVYQRRGLYELAYSYLDKATHHYLDNQETVPAKIHQLRSQAADYKAVEHLKNLLEGLANRRADLIPQILPERLNGHRELNEFILQELVQAARVMVEKIAGVRQITGENQYNDLLLAILQHRFAVWGWSLHDQPRIGTSEAGKDAGEADLLIRSAGNAIALVEALNLKDADYTKGHILKCNFYAEVPRYYIVIYHAGKKQNLGTAWTKYKQDVLAIDYPNGFSLDVAAGFEEVPTSLASDDLMRVGKIRLGACYTMFHLMLALGNKD